MLTDDLKYYCRELAGQPVAIALDEAAKGRLPTFLGQTYEPYQAELFGQTWALLLCKRRDTPTPGEVVGHARVAAQALGKTVAFVFGKLASYERNRLVQKGVPFIVPRRQVFLPGAFVALKEHQEAGYPRPEGKMHSAPAQLVVLFHIQKRKDQEPLPLHEWARLLGYSRMTMTRVCQELVDTGLANRVGRGKVVLLQFKVDRRHQI